MHVLLLVSVVVLSQVEPTPEAVETIHTALRTYNTAEKECVIPFAGAGVFSIAAGALLIGDYGGASDLKRGAGWPTLGVGVVNLIAGIFFSVNAARRLAPLEELLAKDPHEFARTERKHMHRITEFNQPILLIAEAVVTIVGSVLAIVGTQRNSQLMQGIGIGTATQGLGLFLLDWSVLDRARGFTAAVDHFLPE